MTKVLLVGAGSMGGSLWRGWINKGFTDIIVISPHAEGAIKSPDLLPSGFQPDIIVFAVKPQIMGELLPLYSRFINNQMMVVSIAAGTCLAAIRRGIGEEARVVRAMPNLAVTVGAGMTGLYTDSLLTNLEKQLVSDLFSSVGVTTWVESEDQINAVTAVSGSGPAYFYRFVEGLTKASQGIGLSEQISLQLAMQTFVGAADLLRSTLEKPGDLRQRVTSPQGTTAAALAKFDELKLDDVILKAVTAAYLRALELSSS